MKRNLCIFGILLLLLSICGCASKPVSGPYTVEKDGSVYTVDPEAGTISDGTYTYVCDMTPSGSGYKLTITYPNGSTFLWNNSGNSGFGGWSDDYDPARYADGMTLLSILEEKRPVQSSSPGALPFLLLILGLFSAAVPRISWYLGYGWRFKGAEPSDLALAVCRGSGIAAVVIGVILLFV